MVALHNQLGIFFRQQRRRHAMVWGFNDHFMDPYSADRSLEAFDSPGNFPGAHKSRIFVGDGTHLPFAVPRDPHGFRRRQMLVSWTKWAGINIRREPFALFILLG